MNYPEAIQFLYGMQMFGANFGLERVRKLAAMAGNPERKLHFIHVAGTNGKGSTCAILESIYRAAGLRVGLFTSPHLVSFRERIQVNRQMISADDVARLVAETQPLLKHFPAQNHPTMFEIVTVMALRYFAEQQCDLAIWETGLGGRLDATNIITPLASVISNIALDHTEWLGDTLQEIAAEKAGIIKPGVPVITAEEKPEALAVIQRVARDNNTTLRNVRDGRRAAVPNQISLAGSHQQLNAALALATVEVLQKRIPVTAEHIHNGLSNISWPGRLQFIGRGGQKFLLDGAHNLAGVETLRDALKAFLPPSPRRGEGRGEGGSFSQTDNSAPPSKKERKNNITVILGMLADKDWRAMCERLAPLASRILLVPVASQRTATPEQLAEVCRAANPAAMVTACGSLPEALRHAQADAFVVIAGSLYLIGEALALLDPAFTGGGDERGLNEWKPAAR